MKDRSEAFHAPGRKSLSANAGSVFISVFFSSTTLSRRGSILLDQFVFIHHGYWRIEGGLARPEFESAGFEICRNTITAIDVLFLYGKIRKHPELLLPVYFKFRVMRAEA
jgi:hypothetical protein